MQKKGYNQDYYLKLSRILHVQAPSKILFERNYKRKIEIWIICFPCFWSRYSMKLFDEIVNIRYFRLYVLIPRVINSFIKLL